MGAGATPQRIADRIAFASALTSLREAAGLTVRDLAKHADVPTATVSGYLSGRHLPNATQPEVLVAVLTACGVTDPHVHAQWIDAVRRIRQAPGRRSSEARAPYPGLVSFQEDDAPYFFGRGDLTAEIRTVFESVVAGRVTSRIIMLTGPSGSGKSSVLRAAIRPGAKAHGVDTILMRPGERPAAALIAELAAHSGLPDAEVAELVDRGGPVLDELLPDDRPLLLMVDQAEELFTVCAGAAERASFMDRLARLAVATTADGTARVIAVLALRADFYGAAAAEPVLLAALRHTQVVVGPMTRADLTEAIVGPAAATGVHVDDALVQTLLDELAPRDRPGIAHDPGALPMLAHALHATWQVSRRGRMTVEDYLATGGVAGAVERTAEDVWADLDESARELARRIFLRLVLVDEESTVTRRQAGLAELRGMRALPPTGDDGAPSTTVDELIDRFADARLLTIRTDTVEISHEALLGAWGRLRNWVDADRAALRLHRQLADAARNWQRSGQDESYLLREGRLAVVADLFQTGRVAVNDSEHAFIAASEHLRDDRSRDRRTRQRRMRVALAAVAILAVVASGLAVIALRAEIAANDRALEATQARDEATQSRDEATQARDEAQSRELAIAADRLRESNPSLAAQLSLVAYRTAATVDSRAALLDSTALPLPTRIPAALGPTFVALNPAHTVMAVTDAVDGSVALWSVRNPGKPDLLTTLHSAQPDVQKFSVAISPDGRQLAVGSAQGLIERWDIDDPAAPTVLDGPGVVFPSGVLALAFSPNGAQLAAGGAGGIVKRWAVADPGHITNLSGLPAADLISALAWAPNGSMLWGGANAGEVTGWTLGAHGSAGPADNATGAPITLTLATGDVVSVAVSPDGKTLVAGDKGGQIHVWSHSKPGTWVDSADQPAAFDGWVSTIAFAPDGREMAVGSTGSEARLVETATGATLARMQSPGLVTSVAYLGAESLVLGSTDGYVRIWPAPGPVLGPVGATVFGVDMPTDDQVFVGAGAAAGGLHTFDIADRDRPVGIFAPGAVPGTRFDGPLAASARTGIAAEGTADGLVQLWDMSDRSHPRSIGKPFVAAGALVEGLRLSPDGHLLAVASDDSTLHLWDLSDPTRPREVATTENAGGLTFSADFQPGGTLLAASTTAGTVRLWDIADSAHPHFVTDLTGLQGNVYVVTFSPDGHTVAASGAGQEIRLWDVSDPQHPTPIGPPLTKSVGDVSGMRFTPDGKRLIAGGNDGVVWIWDVSDLANPVLRAKLHAVLGSVNSLAISPNGQMLAAGGGAQHVWVWSLDPETAARQICAVQGTGITRAEWDLYVQDRTYAPPCG